LYLKSNKSHHQTQQNACTTLTLQRDYAKLWKEGRSVDPGQWDTRGCTALAHNLPIRERTTQCCQWRIS